MAGVPLLRQRIAEKIEGLYGVQINPDTEITITAGAAQGLFTAIGAFIMDSTINLNSNSITTPIPKCSRRIGKD
jgi:aspartate/methionine/tyrosine aminotransferase